MVHAAAAHSGDADGRLVALLIAITIGMGATQLHQWWQGRREIENPSPPPPGDEGHDEDPQVGDGVTDDGTTDDTDDETPNAWGQIRTRLADGSVLVRRAQAVFRTGSSRLPEDDEQDGSQDDEQDQGEPDAEEHEVRGETRAQFADRLVVQRLRYTDAVAAIGLAYGVSDRTAKRDLAAAQGRGQVDG